MSAATFNDVAFRPAARLEGLMPYSSGARRDAGGLLLDANEGPAAKEAWLERLRTLDADALRRYPVPGALEGAIAARLGVAAERVVVTAGGDDAIDRVCRVSLEPGRRMLTHAPSFEMIQRSARLAGGSVCAVPWMEGAFPVREFIGAIEPGTGLVSLVSPNNPTGGVVVVESMAAVACAAAAVGALVMVDLAYVEFADVDPTPWLLELENVVLVRTFSKAYGLAGMRVGYAVASAAVARWLRTVGGPYPVSGPGLALAGRAREVGPDAGYLCRVAAERDEFALWLRARGVAALDSQGNFVMAWLDAARLADRGVRVRAFGGGLAGWARVTMPGDEASFGRLMAAMEGAIDA